MIIQRHWLAIGLLAFSALACAVPGAPEPTPTLFVLPESLPVTEPAAATAEPSGQEWFDLAEERFDADDLNGAIEGYDRAIAAGFEDAVVWNNRGLANATLGNLEEALADYTRSLEIDANDPITLRNRGVVLRRLERYAEALDDINAALAADANFDEALVSRGIVYLDQNEYDLALADFNAAIALDSGNANAFYFRGFATAIGSGDDVTAVEDFTRAIGLDPTLAKAYYERAYSYQLLGQTDNALADYATFVTLAEKGDPLITEAKQSILELGGTLPETEG